MTSTTSKKIFYIGGGFDILHIDHKKFITRGIDVYKRKYGNPQKIVAGLNSDILLNNRKGKHRPYFSYMWRKSDMSSFLENFEIEYEVILSNDFAIKYKDLNKDIVSFVNTEDKGKPWVNNRFIRSKVEVEYIDPFNTFHVSDIESVLMEMKDKSNCNLRKVGALLLRDGDIIAKGYSGSGNCSTCPKFIAYKKGGGHLSQNVTCKFDHAEVVVLKQAKKGDDLIITDSPCMECAKLILKNEIRRVVFLENYYDTTPVNYLRNNGIEIRKAGLEAK